MGTCHTHGIKSRGNNENSVSVNLRRTFQRWIETWILKEERSFRPMASASMINSLISPLCNSGAKSEVFFLNSSPNSRCQTLGRIPSLKSKKSNLFGTVSSSSVSIVCKAVSAKPETEIDGLNIAKDVTQVKMMVNGPPSLSFSLPLTC